MRNKNWLYSLLLTLVFTSCDLGSSSEPELFTPTDFNVTMAATYDWLRLHTDTYFNLNEMSSDEMIVPPGTSTDASETLLDLHRHTWTDNNEEINQFWIQAYSGVQSANLALFIAESLANAAVPPEVIAEARGIRALAYFQLLDILGNVLFLTENTAPDVAPEQISRKELFEFIESELTEIIPELEIAPTYGRFSRGTAFALLAKLYLNAEVYAGESEWERCRDACEAIISSGVVRLEEDYFNNFVATNEVSDEQLLPAVFTSGNTGIVMDFARRSLHPGQYTPSNGSTTSFRNWVALPELYNLFNHATDLRSNAFYVGQQFSEAGDTLRTNNGFPINYSVEINEDAPYVSGARVVKYLIDEDDLFAGSNDFIIFRYADVLLMRAEALNELGDLAGAVDLINEVRARAFESPEPLDAGSYTQETLRDEILDERARELFWEGFRRQDLIRHGKFCESWTLKDVDDDCEKRKLFPIPANALRDNVGLEQNPGY